MQKGESAIQVGEGERIVGEDTERKPMKRPLNYRRQLVKAVDLFLQQTPDAQARAHRIVRRCQNARKLSSLDDIVWGRTISMLTDSIYYQENVANLPTLRDLLVGKSSTRARTYINADFRNEFTPNELLVLDMAQDLLTFLQGFPFIEVEAAIQTYGLRATALQAISDREGASSSWGEEMIYHLVLREVTEIVTHIDLKLSLLRLGYLAPQIPYNSIWNERNEPNVTETLNWAQKALDAITGKAWLLVTWQIMPDQVCLSFH
jgi:hypothetical protein